MFSSIFLIHLCEVSELKVYSYIMVEGPFPTTGRFQDFSIVRYFIQWRSRFEMWRRLKRAEARLPLLTGGDKV